MLKQFNVAIAYHQNFVTTDFTKRYLDFPEHTEKISDHFFRSSAVTAGRYEPVLAARCFAVEMAELSKQSQSKNYHSKKVVR